MKVARLIFAAAIALPVLPAFAQSTPASLNDDVSAQIAQQQAPYRYTDSSDQTQANINDAHSFGVPQRQSTDVNMGRYSLSVTRPSF